jgi:WD40 repeat protein/class 3 adenylate cyclase
MPTTETRFAVLLFTDIVGSTELKARHGVQAYSEALRTHNGHFERLAHECRHVAILKNLGDGYFAEAGSIAEAVRFALLFQHAMREGPWREVCLTTRVGIHAGEIGTIDSELNSDIVAPAADLAARVMGLALGGQILLTRMPFDEARHFIREHPPTGGTSLPPLRWLAHGPYLVKGSIDPIDIFEIGAEDLAPLVAPPDGEKAKRAIRPGEEETLGWRPAVGLEIPGRPGWLLTELLGVGGFGEVWTGERVRFHQRRAFKFCFDDERLRALKREVTLVRLLGSALGERDDIVRIHELKLDTPPFYLESDLAPHGNLLQWAKKQGGLDQIPLERRIALVAHTATALAAAHSIGVLHKDIKPTNILIFDGPDGEPRPRLVDFGIGALADPTVLGQHGVTAAGFTHGTIDRSTGTPTYSPPEYTAGRPYTIQGDIYGLGVLLYQIITAKPLDPLAPGWERDVPDPLLREDIAACVDGDPARRLPSAADLAERLLSLDERRAEIEEGELLARESAARAKFEAAAKEARRHAASLRKLAGAFAALAMMAVAGGALAWMNQRKATTALAEVEVKKAEVDRRNSEYRAMLVEAARSDRVVAEEKLQAGLKREAFAHLARACEYDPGSSFAAEKAVVALNDWPYLLPTTILTGHKDGVTSACFSPDGTRIVTASWDESARVWDAQTGENLAILAGNGGEVVSVMFSPDGAAILTASTGESAKVWDAATGRCLATLAGYDGGLTSARFSPDGGRIVTTSLDRTARVWETATGKCLITLAGHEGGVTGAQFNPAGTRIVTASEDNSARVWDPASGKCLVTLAGHQSTVRGACFSPDGKLIVTASADKSARLWDTATGRSLATLTGHEAGLLSARFCADGSRVATASEDKTARVWDVVTGQSLATLAEHAGGVTDVHFSPDGSRIVTASLDQTARLWDAATGRLLATLAGHEGGVMSAQFSPDGNRIVTASWDQSARVWNATTRISSVTFAGHEGGVTGLQFSPDSKRLVTASRDQTARVWDTATGQSLATLTGHEGGVTSAQFSPNGARIVTASEDKTARVWAAATGKCLATLTGHEGSVMSAQFSLDGARVFTAAYDDTTRVWDAVTGKNLTILAGHKGTERSVQFSPDGKRIVIAAEDNTARVWDAATDQSLATFAGHEADVLSARFSPDGSRIVTASLDKTARVWDAATGICLATLTGHKLFVTQAAFSPDGSRIVTASEDKTERLWDVATGKTLAILTGHETTVWSAQFSPDGTHIVTASPGAETARLWDILQPTAGQPPQWFADFLRYLAQMRLKADGELETLKPADWLALRNQLRGVRPASDGRDTPYLAILRHFLPG